MSVMVASPIWPNWFTVRRRRFSLSFGRRRQRTKKNTPTARTASAAARIRMSSRFCDDGIFKNTDARNFDCYFRSGYDRPDARRSPGGDQVTWFQRHDSGDIGDDSIHAEQHFSDGAVLLDAAIHERANAVAGKIGFFGGNDARAYRAKGIEAFAARELAVLTLQIARRYVVHDGVTKDVVARLGGVHVPRSPAHHDA